jgi:hypothetical protein
MPNKVTARTFDLCVLYYRRGQKSLGPLKMSREMAHKVIVPQKNYVPQFLKQRDINSFYLILSAESQTAWVAQRKGTFFRIDLV